MREVDAGDVDAAPGQRRSDPAGADRELEGSSAGKRKKEVHNRLDRHLRRVRVVAGRDVPGEPVLHSGSVRRTLIEMFRVT